jgi:hypothetical protein
MEIEYFIGKPFYDPDLGNEIIRHFPLGKNQRIEKRKKAGAFVMCIIQEKEKISTLDLDIKSAWVNGFIDGYSVALE